MFLENVLTLFPLFLLSLPPPSEVVVAQLQLVLINEALMPYLAFCEIIAPEYFYKQMEELKTKMQ